MRTQFVHDVLETLCECHIEVARARDVDLALDQNAARPRRHHKHAVGKEHCFAQVVGHEANGDLTRGMIGAVVGTQPFGGAGLSGTGPKAGGPNYLRRFATEQTVTVNTAAAGGNATLLSEGE